MLFKSSHQVVAFLGASLLLAISSSSASAFDVDCGEGYTGYSLKLGTQCRSYVYCSSGKVSSTTECPGSLIYDGNVGVGGVCGWPDTVTCADAGASSGESASSTSLSVNVDSDEANTLANLLKVNPSPSPPPPSPPSANSFVISAPTPPMTTTTTMSTMDLSSNDTGYCGSSRADAEAKCVPCVDRLCRYNTEACWMSTSCSSSSSSSSVSQPSPATITDFFLLSQPSPSSTSYATTSTSASTASESTSAAASESTSVETASVPSASTTLPPWTNAPFTPYNGPRRDKTVIGYYASWQWYDRTKFADPPNIDWSKYDRVNYAFFQIDKEGNIFGTDEWADAILLFGPYMYDESKQIQTGPGANYFCSWDGPNLRNCNFHDTSKSIIELAHKAGTTVMPSIGGWTLSDNFPTVAASERTRQNFARNCVKLIEEYSEYMHVMQYLHIRRLCSSNIILPLLRLLLFRL